MSIDYLRQLPEPEEIIAEYPLTDEIRKVREKRDREIFDVFEGKSDRLILIIGPCSADNKDSVMDYIGRLKTVQEKVSDKILIIPRVYTNKPRTNGKGYKGMLHQPDPHEKPDMLGGLLAIRDLHLSAIRDYGFGCADEMLYPENYRYISDVLSYVAVGARSVENQQHRLTASGISVPVGMKNPTEGDLTIMMNSINAAQHSHTFIYRDWEVKTSGNPLTHAILRGYTDMNGVPMSNYHYEDLLRLNELYKNSGLVNPAVIVDANHANSGKRYLEQIRIAKDVTHSRRANAEIGRLVKGIMIESYIEDGAQKIGENVYGKSITDPCLGWEKTEQLIMELADEL